jgi:hypothetical protein
VVAVEQRVQVETLPATVTPEMVEPVEPVLFLLLVEHLWVTEVVVEVQQTLQAVEQAEMVVGQVTVVTLECVAVEVVAVEVSPIPTEVAVEME